MQTSGGRMSDVTPEAKVGRPSKYKEEYNEQAYKLCLLGATDKELADFFNVDESTINNWKHEYPEFLESIKRGKILADANVSERLYKRACGVTVSREQAVKIKELVMEGDQAVEKEVIQIVRLSQEQPPDTTAGIFWLKNRQPEKWRDKPEPQDGENNATPVKVVVEVKDARKPDS
ncbi:hypothetical protein [Psychrobacter sp. I-STPA6b]|uniref:hypothetical protein n=1 Tax=Psychrobacter sp. I-STPA6b TaxID=2585718 RepID=UPI001D0C9FB3|nr:hypothetical protein [Psychrobacter sp. I-STPA6b]